MKTIAILILAFGAVVSGGCSTTGEITDVPVSAGSTQYRKIEVAVDSDRHVRITNAQALPGENTVKVSGTLRPKSSTTRMAGHVHVSFIDAGGDVVLHRTVEPSTKAFFRRSILKPRFNQIFKLETTTVSSVLLKHHKGSGEACSDVPLTVM